MGLGGRERGFGSAPRNGGGAFRDHFRKFSSIESSESAGAPANRRAFAACLPNPPRKSRPCGPGCPSVCRHPRGTFRLSTRQSLRARMGHRSISAEHRETFRHNNPNREDKPDSIVKLVGKMETQNYRWPRNSDKMHRQTSQSQSRDGRNGLAGSASVRPDRTRSGERLPHRSE